MTADDGPLRVAFFGHAEGRRGDGLSTYSRELVRALRAQGVVVRFFAHAEDGTTVPVDGDQVGWLRARRFKTVTIPRRGSLRLIREQLADFGPDVVHISWSFSLLDGAITRIAHHLGAACIATFHLPHGPAGSARGIVLQGLYRYHRRQMTHVDLCIALSDGQRDLLARAGYPSDRIAVIPNGVDVGAITPGPSSLKEELGARIVVQYIGRLDPEKRVAALIEAFLELELPADHVLAVAGDGVQRGRLARLAARHDNVRLLGLVSSGRALELLRGCDVFVLPSTAEGLALSLLEAMAAGCAIIATDAGEDGRALEGAGLVIPTHPLRPALDAALGRLLGDPDLRARLGQAARQRVVERYSMAGSADRVIAAYEKASATSAVASGTARPAALP
jgi:glycosyltransferase involved in cell wall biosynthesis